MRICHCLRRHRSRLPLRWRHINQSSGQYAIVLLLLLLHHLSSSPTTQAVEIITQQRCRYRIKRTFM